MFKGPNPQKLNGQLGGRTKNTDKTFALIAGGVAVTNKLVLGQILELLQPEDATAYGIDAAYDANNKVLVRYHIDEFFTGCPDGILFVMIVPQGTDLVEMCDKDGDNDPAGPGSLMALMRSETTRREIKSIGIVLNPASGYAPTLENGLDKDVLDAIPAAQACVEELSTQFIFLDSVIVEGREVNGTLAAMKDLTTLAAPNVAVVIAADPSIQALDALYEDYAAVGTALGGLAIRKVNECLGSVDILSKPDAKKAHQNYTLTNAALGRWQKASLSSGVKFEDLTPNDQKALTDKGYIYAGSYAGYTGVFFNESPTCTDPSDDYSTIERNRTWNKAARYLRQALIPKMKGTYKKDPNTGYPKPSVVAGWELLAKKKLELMVIDDEVSGVDVYINPSQAPSKDVPLTVNCQLVIDGILYEINIPIGLANSI